MTAEPRSKRSPRTSDSADHAARPRPCSPPRPHAQGSDAAASAGLDTRSPRSRPSEYEDLIAILEAEDHFDVRADLSRVTSPTLVIGGGQDGYYPTDLFTQTAASVVDGTFVELPRQEPPQPRNRPRSRPHHHRLPHPHRAVTTPRGLWISRRFRPDTSSGWLGGEGAVMATPETVATRKKKGEPSAEEEAAAVEPWRTPGRWSWYCIWVRRAVGRPAPAVATVRFPIRAASPQKRKGSPGVS